MRADELNGEEDFRDKITVAGRVERIRRDRAKPERLLEQHPIDGKARARECTGTERHLGGAAARVPETLLIAHQRPGMSEEHVRPAHRLRTLTVRIAGKNRVEPAFCLDDERTAERGNRGIELVDRGQRPEPKIGRDLVIARASGVQLSRHRTDLGVEQALDQRVHIFVGRADRGAVRELLSDVIEAVE